VARRLVNAPIFTLVTLLTIGIGVGANTAIFSVVDGVLLKPLPYPEPERLVSVMQTAPGLNIKDLNISPPDYFTFRDENTTFESFGIWQSNRVTVTGLGEPEQVRSLSMTEGVLNALRVPPVLGRWFTAQDDTFGNPETVILTHDYWQRKFGGNGSAIGQTLRVDGELRQIVGVMPESFRFLDRKADLILPFQFDRSKVRLGNFSYTGIARLKPGVSIAQASEDVRRMMPRVLTRFPSPAGFTVKSFEAARIAPNLRPSKQDIVGDLGKVLWVLMGSIGLVLLIACANVANLLLVRVDARQQELGVRAALGASSRQIGGELLLESLLLGSLGGAAGLGIAYGALRLLVSIAPASLPRLESITIDVPALLFTFAISFAAALLFGIIPVMKYAGASVTSALRAGGRTLSQSKEAHGARNTLVIAQVALCVVLVISAGLMIRTFQALRRVEPGFSGPEQLQVFFVFIPEAQVKETDRVLRMLQQILDKVSQVPGVETAGFANSVPTDGNNTTDVLFIEGRDYAQGQIPPVRQFKYVAPGFFKAMSTRLVAGRDYNWGEIYAGRNVSIISENLARELWHDPQTAIGKRIREGAKDAWWEIVGVVQDVHLNGPDRPAPAIVYEPAMVTVFWANPTFVTRSAAFAIRSSRAGSAGFLKEIQQAVWSVNPDLPLAGVRTMKELYRESMARSSFTLVMLAIAGGMALLLGIVGIYGVISYSVSQRTREMGIRIALGARPGELKAMVMGNGLSLAAIGVALGLIGAATVTRVMSSFLFGVNSVDPLTYIIVSAGLLAIAAGASYLPAHRVSAIDPIEALRAE